MVAEGEDKVVAGWLQYGAALNEGRKLHTRPNGTEDDVGFGKWKRANIYENLSEIPLCHDEAAAMWAAANPLDFLLTRKGNPSVRTVRGVHAKFNEAKRLEPTASFIQFFADFAKDPEDQTVEQQRRALI